MSFTVQCAKCGQTGSVPDEAAGQSIRCASCRAKILIPDQGDSEVAKPGSIRTQPCPFCAEDIRIEAIKCKHCGESLVELPRRRIAHKTPPKTNSGTDVLRMLSSAVGILLILCGSIGFVASYNMDTSVEVPQLPAAAAFGLPQNLRVHNIGRIEERRNYMILSGVACAAGLFPASAGRIFPAR